MDIGEIIEMRIMTEKEGEVGVEKEHIQMIVEGETGIVVIVDQGQDQEQVQIQIELGCYKCREYDHFAKDCPTTKEEREIE